MFRFKWQTTYKCTIEIAVSYSMAFDNVQVLVQLMVVKRINDY